MLWRFSRRGWNPFGASEHTPPEQQTSANAVNASPFDNFDPFAQASVHDLLQLCGRSVVSIGERTDLEARCHFTHTGLQATVAVLDVWNRAIGIATRAIRFR